MFVILADIRIYFPPHSVFSLVNTFFFLQIELHNYTHLCVPVVSISEIKYFM